MLSLGDHKAISENTGMNVYRFLSGSQGGDQQIGARVAYNEIDLVLFFRDPVSPAHFEPDVSGLLKLCDTHNIPVATNLAASSAYLVATFPACCNSCNPAFNPIKLSS